MKRLASEWKFNLCVMLHVYSMIVERNCYEDSVCACVCMYKFDAIAEVLE